MKQNTVGKPKKNVSKKVVGKVDSDARRTKSTVVHKKLEVSKSTKKSRNNPMPISRVAKKIVSGGIIICAVIVLMCLIVNTYYDPAKVATRKLEELAKDYYENYYYDKLLEEIGEEGLVEQFESLNGKGMANVPLRHLLLFDNARNEEYGKFFDNTRYHCDRSETNVKIFPEEPYGRQDYSVEYTTVCERVQ